MGGNPSPETFLIEGFIDIPYEYSAGRLGSRFLIEIRDNKRIIGVKCSACSKVYVPPRSTCKECFATANELVEVSTKGTLIGYTVVHQAKPVHLVPSPFAYGIVRLDGADTGLLHFLGEVEFKQLKIGMKVEAVFEDEEKIGILNIKHFRPQR